MIASWPQAALRGSSSVASPGPPGCICLIGNTRVRSVARLSSPQRTEAARLKEASTEVQPSTLPETWERSSLSDHGIREALRARSKHYAALDEVDQADSATMSPEREQEQDDAQISKEQIKRRKQRMAKPSVSTPAPKSSEGTAAKDDGLSERQRRRKRVGWALHQRNGGKARKGSKEKQPDETFTRELEVQLCSQVQEAQRLRQVYEDACSKGEHFSEQQWAQAGGLSSVGALQDALQAGTAAQKRLLKEHRGFVCSLVNKHVRQGLTHEEMMIEASSAFITAAERFDASRNARLPSFAWFHVMDALQRLCQNEGALLPVSTSATRHIRRLSEAESQLRQKTGEDPSLAEIAAQAGISAERARLLRSRQNVVAYESITTTSKTGVTRGADELVGDDKEHADSQDPALSINEREKALHMRAVVNLALDALACKDGAPGYQPERYQLMAAAMRLRYGLDDNKPLTLKEVGAALRAQFSAKYTSIEAVRVLIEDGKERLALIMAQEGLLTELQLSI